MHLNTFKTSFSRHVAVRVFAKRVVTLDFGKGERAGVDAHIINAAVIGSA